MKLTTNDMYGFIGCALIVLDCFVQNGFFAAFGLGLMVPFIIETEGEEGEEDVH